MSASSSNPLVTLITGGAKCGKSSHALKLAEAAGDKRYFLATAEARDGEMVERIRRHREERGASWNTIEEPLEVVGALSPLPDGAVVIFDCVTLWLSNLMMKHGENAEPIEREIRRFNEFLLASRQRIFVVSNEVGMGIVPADPLSRLYRDLAGTANQSIARTAGNVILMVSGIPVNIKQAW